VLAGLVGRSESWLSQVERGKRGVDSYVVLTRMAEVLRVEVEELTGPGGVGADNLCHQAVFVDDATYAVVPPDPEMIQVGDAIWQRP
jgi:transcriptional regulator with XRE-family HTH domain